jgi:hypothetical protein
MDAFLSKHADFYNLPDDTRYNTSAKSSNHKIKVLAKVTIDDSAQSQQTISQILNLEGMGTQSINQKALLTSNKDVLCPDWATGLEGETVTCEGVTFKGITSLPILEGCLTATCDKWENGKSYQLY